jgi:predicted small secreted protein
MSRSGDKNASTSRGVATPHRERFLASEMRHFQSRFKRKEGEAMRLKTIIWALYLACSLAGTLGSIACNAVHGMGQDIERGGEKTQDAADAVKRRM